jgi:hypothetical protein
MQIWSALITVLIVTFLKSEAKDSWSFSGLLFLIRQNNHQQKNIIYLINHAKDNLSKYQKTKKTLK